MLHLSPLDKKTSWASLFGGTLDSYRPQTLKFPYHQFLESVLSDWGEIGVLILPFPAAIPAHAGEIFGPPQISGDAPPYARNVNITATCEPNPLGRCHESISLYRITIRNSRKGGFRKSIRRPPGRFKGPNEELIDQATTGRRLCFL